MSLSDRGFGVWLNVSETRNNVVFLTPTEIVVGSYLFSFDRGVKELQAGTVAAPAPAR